MPTYTNMEGILHHINRNYVTLQNDHVKYNNEILKLTLWELIGHISSYDPLFKKLFEKPYFGGSYYDDLKVGQPDEFDLDLLLVIPRSCETHKRRNCGCLTITPSNKPGFFWIKIKENYYSPLNKFLKDGYLQRDLILNWLKSRVAYALNKVCMLRSSSIHDYELKPQPVSYYSESGPALTLRLWGDFGHFDVDLVPAFKFGAEHWPTAGFRSNGTNKADFFLVPKGPKDMPYSERFWRASFQDQEREIIKGKERLKPTLRLLKKMRNNLAHNKISSYALKTIVLWEMDTNYFNFNGTLSETFMKLLEKYKDSLNKKRIPYYWKENNNLLEDINPIALENHYNEISRLLRAINSLHISDPLVVAKVILKEGTEDYRKFIAEFNQQNRTSNINSLSVRHSNEGNPYFSFDPASSQQDRSESDRSRNMHTSGGMMQDSDNSSNGWRIAGAVVLGVGALAAAGVGTLVALNRNRRNQNH